MHYKNLIMIIVIILLLLILYFIQKENFNDKNYSFQSLQNLSSVFGDINGTLSVNNIKIIDRLDAANFKGIIVQWSGSIESIPNGWALCDGYGGRPDLRGRFILGYNNENEVANKVFTTSEDSTYITPPGQSGGVQIGADLAGQIGNVGGEVQHKLTINEIPAHTHDYRFIETPFFMTAKINDAWIRPGNDAGKVSARPTDIAGNNDGYPLIPPYYVIAFIIKL